MIIFYDCTDYKGIDNVEEDHEQFTAKNKLDKLNVVLGPDAVVEPFTMMVKILDASVTGIAMKRPLTYTSFAQVTEIFVLLGVE